MKQLELLAPARDLACGVAAIDCGADAVYIGATRFGARSSATNSIDDVAALCRYAHRFGARVYATVNTIVYDNELAEAKQLVGRLADAGVDAVLVQDMAIAEAVRLTPMALHASTQTDNRTADKVVWLHSQGFSRAVLARELSAEEIAKIHSQVPDMELEVFVHGALCVGLSGLCYASQHCFGRSANRGECSQFCRLRFDLEDADGRVIESGRHFLSLKDLNLADHLGRLVEAGATSFKIEGRLKDINYVRNVTAAYSQRLNDIVRMAPGLYQRASRGECRYAFEPNLAKTFNRGFTTYFVDGRQRGIASFDTPKAIGEYVGMVRTVDRRTVTMDSTAVFANGDGLCFVNGNGELEGFRVNRADGRQLTPLRVPATLRPGMRVFRNNDADFERQLARQETVRRLPLRFTLRPTANGFALRAAIADWHEVEVTVDMEHQRAQTPQRDNIVRILSKLGGTIYECAEVDIADDFDLFLPSSTLTALRRQAIEALQSVSEGRPSEAQHEALQGGADVPRYAGSGFYHNISNSEARQFYAQQGLDDAAPAYELRPDNSMPIMQCRHCLRFELGFCERRGGRKASWREPLYLALPDGRRFRLAFDCARCIMLVFANQ